MKWLLRLGVSLYPRWWRDRYGGEFEALIEDTGLTGRDAVDVVRGGVVMRITDRRALPLHAALIGAMLGAAIHLLTPDLYVSAATLRLKSSGFTEPASGESQAFLDRVARAVPTPQEKAATSITILESSPDSAVVRMTYTTSDAQQAQAAVSRLVRAAVGPSRLEDLGVAVLAGPVLPTRPEHKSAFPVAFGGSLGLLAGILLVKFLRRSS